ncbi:hypothetical protein [Bacillus sp. 196mf]|uniref:hypothetical protein n=1 Tax=Bacillus sp. 196mf TaxID=1761754 RepID=UPI000D7BBFBA|nr:hypothetical protein [Bacillus sp. 196mf]PYE89769.1 hypothetical protein ATL10_10332 [Bacillus sp. 196mf]
MKLKFSKHLKKVTALSVGLFALGTSISSTYAAEVKDINGFTIKEGYLYGISHANKNHAWMGYDSYDSRDGSDFYDDLGRGRKEKPGLAYKIKSTNVSATKTGKPIDNQRYYYLEEYSQNDKGEYNPTGRWLYNDMPGAINPVRTYFLRSKSPLKGGPANELKISNRNDSYVALGHNNEFDGGTGLYTAGETDDRPENLYVRDLAPPISEPGRRDRAQRFILESVQNGFVKKSGQLQKNGRDEQRWEEKLHVVPGKTYTLKFKRSAGISVYLYNLERGRTFGPLRAEERTVQFVAVENEVTIGAVGTSSERGDFEIEVQD